MQLVIPGFDNPPERAPRLRRAPDSNFLYVRRVKGGAWQARYWLGAHAGGSLNLGLFTVSRWETEDDAEWAAARASKEFGKFYAPIYGRGLKETLEHLKHKRWIPEDVLPPRVKISPDGNGFIARVRKAGRIIETPGVFKCPWECYRVMCKVLAHEFPDAPSKSELRKAAKERELRERAQRNATAMPTNLFGETLTAEEVFANECRAYTRRKLRLTIKRAIRDEEPAEFVASMIRRLHEM